MVVLTTFSQPTEGIRHRQPDTTAYVNDNILGKGTLYIAESCLSWIRDSRDGFSIEYSNISLHAVSRDLAAFSQECLFLMLDIALGDEETKSESGENGDDNDGSDHDRATTELRFVPDDRGMLDAMFHAMNACQALHPDPEDSVSDDDIYEITDDDIQMEETDSRLANLNIGVHTGVQGEAFSLSNKHMGFDLRGIWEQEGEGRVEDKVEDKVEDMVEDMVEDRLEVDMVEDRVEVGMGEGKVVEDSEVVEGSEVADDNMVEEGRVVDRLVDQVCRVQDDRSFPVGGTRHQDSMVPLHQGQSSHTASHFSDAES